MHPCHPTARVYPHFGETKVPDVPDNPSPSEKPSTTTCLCRTLSKIPSPAGVGFGWAGIQRVWRAGKRVEFTLTSSGSLSGEENQMSLNRHVGGFRNPAYHDIIGHPVLLHGHRFAH